MKKLWNIIKPVDAQEAKLYLVTLLTVGGFIAIAIDYSHRIF